jgi:hypothetical protein
MQVTILEVVAPEAMRVRFFGSVGEGIADWHGDAPRVGGSYDVELDVDQDPVWGDTLWLSADVGALPEQLTGLIEVYDETSMVLRVGDGLVQVTPVGEAPLGASEGARVVIDRPHIHLWPANL